MTYFNSNSSFNTAKRVPNNSKNIAVFKKHLNNLDASHVLVYRNLIQTGKFQPTLLYFPSKCFTKCIMGGLVDYATNAPLSRNVQYVVAPCIALLEACKDEGIDVYSLNQVEIYSPNCYAENIITLFAYCPELQYLSDISRKKSDYAPQGCGERGINISSLAPISAGLQIWSMLYVNDPSKAAFRGDFMNFSTAVIQSSWHDALNVLGVLMESYQDCSDQVNEGEAIQMGNEVAADIGLKLHAQINAFIETLNQIYHTGSDCGEKKKLFMARYKNRI